VAVHRAAPAYRLAFVMVLPDPADPARPVVRGVTPKLMFAEYADPATDKTPHDGDGRQRVTEAEVR
jgi:hypothetical protein